MKINKLVYMLSITLALSAISFPATITSTAKEQEVDVARKVYEFGEKSEYEIDSSEPISKSDITLGNLSLKGDITNTYTQDGITAYEIANDTLFSLHFDYDESLKNADDSDWHLTDDNKKKINDIEIGDKIEYGAVLMQTSFDGKKWFTAATFTNISDDVDFNSENGINDIQLANGCYYRFIVVYKAEKMTNESKVLFVDTSDYEYKKYAEVYEFYAGYKERPLETSGKKYYFNTMDYTQSTKKNDYVGNERIDAKDPHYGWELGSFCLSGYTDNGDTSDIYLKTVGNRIRLSYELKQDITKLNDNDDLEIARDKKGSDGTFQTKAHDMGRGELIIKYTDAEGKSRITEYSNYLEALASPGADTTIQLFEEGDYEIHLNYAITDKKGINSTSYYRTSFSFKIRNGNCMVYIFDATTGAELGNGSVTENGFRIDTAKSSYPKLTIRKEILNNTANGLVEDTRFNMAATDGSIYTDEGIYTVSAFNRFDEKLEPAVKTIYVGSNNILTAYTRHMNTNDPYTIDQLNNLVDEGYTITDDGDIISPAAETAIPVIALTDAESITERITETETVAAQTTVADSTTDDEKHKSPIIPILCGILAVAGIGVGAGYYVLRNKKKQ